MVGETIKVTGSNSGPKEESFRKVLTQAQTSVSKPPVGSAQVHRAHVEV